MTSSSTAGAMHKSFSRPSLELHVMEQYYRRTSTTIPGYMEVLQQAARRRVLTNDPDDEWRRAMGWVRRWVRGRTKFVAWRVMNGLRITGMPRRTEIVDQARELCKDYLQLKLKRAGLSSRKLAEHDEPLSDVSVEIQRLAVQLEVLFPNLYRNICKQLNVRLSSDEVLRTNFAAVAEQIFKGDITWGKIVSLFSLAGAFAVDCVQCGHAEYMNTIVSSFENFVDTNLSEWIAMQGGWLSLVKVCRTSDEYGILWALSAGGAILGFVLTLMATVQV